MPPARTQSAASRALKASTLSHSKHDGGAAPITLTRQIDRTEDGFRVTDDISRGASGPRVKSLRLGVGQTSSYTAVSQPWDPAWLLPWVDLDDEVEKLNKDGHIQVTRQF